ncbi:MAG TPA: efflux transporter outer membrane subunit [Methylibium sp.]
MSRKRTAWRTGSLALAALLALSGCTMIPKLERPAPPVAAQWPSAQGAAGAVAATALPWQDYFADARLSKLIELALQNNRDLRVAVLSIEQVRAQYQIQRADLLPTVSLAATGSRSPAPPAGSGNVYSFGLSLSSFEIDLFGRVRSLSEAAFAKYLATQEGARAAQISLVASVASTALAWQADQELLQLTQDTLKTREESLKLTQLKFDNGASSELDLRQAQSLVENANAALAQQQRLLAVDVDALTLLVGQPLPADLVATSTPLADLHFASVPAGLPSEVLVQRPDVREAERQLVAANADIGAARAAFFPRISLTASGGFASNALSSLFKHTAWTASDQAVMPIFDYGRNSANLAVANTGRDIAVAQYEKAIQSAFREVADALAGEATLGEQLRAQQAQADAETARFKLVDLRYRNGASSYLELLDAQRSLFAAQQAAIQVRLAQLQNSVALYRSLGGGWSAAKSTDQAPS